MFALASGCTTWRRGTAEKPVVTRVEFLGNERVGDRELQPIIRAQESAWQPFANPRRFDADGMDEDVLRILRYYRARGFYDARVDGWRLAGDGRGRASVGFVIDEGKPSRVRSFEVQGVEEIPGSDRRFVLRDLPLGLGQRFDERLHDQTKGLIEQRLRQRGYAHAEVSGEVVIDPVARTARVTYRADTGERYKLGAITVTGAEATSNRPILYASALRSGQLFDESKIDDAQGRIFDLGVYRAVAIEPGEPTPDDRLPINIRVREGPLQAFEWGVGGGIDRTMQRVRTRVTWRHRDLFGGLDHFEATMRMGYAVLPTIADPIRDGPIWGAEAQFRRPNFLDRRVTLASQLRLDHMLYEAYTEDSARGTVGLERRIWEVGLGAAYGLHLYRLTQLRTVTGAEDVPPNASPDRCPEPCTISFLETRAWWDHRDDVVEPRRGWYVETVLEQGGGVVLGGTHEYQRANPEARVFATPDVGERRLTLAARVEAGFMLPAGGPSPVVRRFFGGGPDSHRGYATHRLSPKVHRKGGGTVPIGGDNLFESSFETRVWIGHRIIGVAFVDAGAVEFRRNTLDPNRIAWAVGPGLRYLSPIGPVRLDVGYLIRSPRQRTLDAPYDVVREPLWAVHVGLGEAF